MISGFVDRLNSYTVDYNLCVLWDKYHVDYTYLHIDQFSTSTIDHLIMTNNIYIMTKVVICSPWRTPGGIWFYSMGI